MVVIVKGNNRNWLILNGGLAYRGLVYRGLVYKGLVYEEGRKGYKRRKG